MAGNVESWVNVRAETGPCRASLRHGDCSHGGRPRASDVARSLLGGYPVVAVSHGGVAHVCVGARRAAVHAC
eukprot:356541-Chlamydomonas_euryale.AAC.1